MSDPRRAMSAARVAFACFVVTMLCALSSCVHINTAWLLLALRSGYRPADQRVDEVLSRVGRTRYLRPLYRALAERDPARAQALFARNAAKYHPITRQVIASALKADA